MSLIGHFYGKLIYGKTQPEVLVNLHLTNIPNASFMQQHKKHNTNEGYTIPNTSLSIILSFTNNICPHNTCNLKTSHETSWFKKLTMWCTILECLPRDLPHKQQNFLSNRSSLWSSHSYGYFLLNNRTWYNYNQERKHYNWLAIRIVLKICKTSHHNLDYDA
jgi:hypothetical protein